MFSSGFGLLAGGLVCYIMASFYSLYSISLAAPFFDIDFCWQHCLDNERVRDIAFIYASFILLTLLSSFFLYTISG